MIQIVRLANNEFLYTRCCCLFNWSNSNYICDYETKKLENERIELIREAEKIKRRYYV